MDDKKRNKELEAALAGMEFNYDLDDPDAGYKKIWWRPERGSHTIRLLPASDGNSIVEMRMHWFKTDSGTRGFVCPRQTTGKCPSCSYGFELRNRDAPGDVELAKEFFAKSSYIVNIIDRNDPEMTVYVWGMGYRLYNEQVKPALELARDQGLERLHPIYGTDLTVVRTPPKRGELYDNTKATFSIATSPIIDEPDALRDVLGERHDLQDLTTPDVNTLPERLKQFAQVMGLTFDGHAMLPAETPDWKAKAIEAPADEPESEDSDEMPW